MVGESIRNPPWMILISSLENILLNIILLSSPIVNFDHDDLQVHVISSCSEESLFLTIIFPTLLPTKA
jgi:hypothetical protein